MFLLAGYLFSAPFTGTSTDLSNVFKDYVVLVFDRIRVLTHEAGSSASKAYQ